MKIFEEELKLWDTRAKNHIVSALPPHLDIELTNRCNLTCKQCPYHGKDAPFKQIPMDMEFEVYKNIIDEASVKNVRSVKLSYSGEPLLYPKFVEAVEYAKGRGLQVNINSNGLLLDREMCIKLIKAKLDVIILSNYGSSELYRNICVLQTQKQIFKSTKPYVLLKTEYLESKKFKGIVDECVGLSYDDYCNLEENYESSEFECGYPWQRLLILAAGDVVSCACAMGTYDMERSFLGNVLYSELEDLWHSAKMQFLRLCHADHQTHLMTMCRWCPMRNREINKMKKG